MCLYRSSKREAQSHHTHTTHSSDGAQFHIIIWQYLHRNSSFEAIVSQPHSRAIEQSMLRVELHRCIYIGHDGCKKKYDEKEGEKKKPMQTRQLQTMQFQPWIFFLLHHIQQGGKSLSRISTQCSPYHFFFFLIQHNRKKNSFAFSAVSSSIRFFVRRKTLNGKQLLFLVAMCDFVIFHENNSHRIYCVFCCCCSSEHA